MLSLAHRCINSTLKNITSRSLYTKQPQATQRSRKVDDEVIIAEVLLHSEESTTQQPVYNAGRISRSYLD